MRCKAGFISTNPAVCGEDGKWRQGICLHECPTLDISGDCATSGNQKYKIQEHMINERPHYKSAVSMSGPSSSFSPLFPSCHTELVLYDC